MLIKILHDTRHKIRIKSYKAEQNNRHSQYHGKPYIYNDHYHVECYSTSVVLRPQVPVEYLLTASVMSAPAALVASKIAYPSERSKDDKKKYVVGTQG